jgi:hypothetical protein
LQEDGNRGKKAGKKTGSESQYLDKKLPYYGYKPWVSLRQLTPVNKAVNKQEQLEKGLEQGCQIFLCATYQNGKNIRKEMAVK